MDYYIRSFQSDTGIISVEYFSGEYISFPLPINQQGLVPVGDELHALINKMKPVKPESVTIANSRDIVKLLTPFPPKTLTLDELRVRRNKMLGETDWTQAADAPLTEKQKQDWAAYRQELRNMTSDPDLNLSAVVWPTPPKSYQIPEFISTL